MTHEERVKRVAGFGFTHRQAAFLVEVMLHSGFFLGRQYCAFARIVRGQKLVDFLQKLTSRKLAQKAGALKSIKATIGLDGFVDEIIAVVDKRHGPGEHYEPVKTIEAGNNAPKTEAERRAESVRS